MRACSPLWCLLAVSLPWRYRKEEPKTKDGGACWDSSSSVQERHRKKHIFTWKSYFFHVEEISSHACSSKPSSLHYPRLPFSPSANGCDVTQLPLLLPKQFKAILPNEARRALSSHPNAYINRWGRKCCRGEAWQLETLCFLSARSVLFFDSRLGGEL